MALKSLEFKIIYRKKSYSLKDNKKKNSEIIAAIFTEPVMRQEQREALYT